MLQSRESQFHNPEKLPLGKLFFCITDNEGVQVKVPALSERWSTPRQYAKYQPLVTRNGQLINSADLDEWLDNATWFLSDMDYLLQLKHYQFWSHVVFDSKCINAIRCFLQESVPFYLEIAVLLDDANLLILYHNIINAVIRVIKRITTEKESDEEWIEKHQLRQLLYNKYLITVPMYFDLLITYGPANLAILSDIAQQAFQSEPKYKKDLEVGLRCLQKVLRDIEAHATDEKSQPGPALTSDDLAIFTLDCACTLNLFVNAYPDSRALCHELHIEQSISRFYENAIPIIFDKIYTVNPAAQGLDFLNRSRVELLKAFRSVIYFHIENIFESVNRKNQQNADNFMNTLTECLADTIFVEDYQRHYPVEDDIILLKQAYNGALKIDDLKTNFILKAYSLEEEGFFGVDNKADGVDENVNLEAEYEYEDLAAALVETEQSEKFRDTDQEVVQVLEVFPHLGDGFVRKLLSRYENVEDVISAILEGNLPLDLAEADPSEVYIPKDPQDEFYLQTSIRRNNVFDGDEYDVITQDNPKCIIKRGKGIPGQPKTAEALLNDKSHITALKSRYESYSLVDENADYDDEYDDSCDALTEGAPRIPKSAKFIEEDVDESEEESESSEGGAPGNGESKEYLENPATIRARYEAKRNANIKPQRDVVGKHKGQGQDKSVIVNRNKKEVHKSSRANHNRKSGAAWKRNRGMIPS